MAYTARVDAVQAPWHDWQLAIGLEAAIAHGLPRHVPVDEAKGGVVLRPVGQARASNSAGQMSWPSSAKFRCVLPPASPTSVGSQSVTWKRPRWIAPRVRAGRSGE